MKKKIVALMLATVLCVSTSMTAFADSSTVESNSSTVESSGDSSNTSTASTAAKTSSSNTSKASASAALAKSTKVAVVSANGSVSAVSLETVVTNAAASIVSAAASAPTSAVAAINSLLTSAVTPQFTATVEALAEVKGSDMVVNNMGTVNTVATATDAFGNTIASAGVVENVTSGALVLLMSVNADGTVEYVEGVVDPVTGVVMGAFQGTPAVITVLVLA